MHPDIFCHVFATLASHWIVGAVSRAHSGWHLVSTNNQCAEDALRLRTLLGRTFLTTAMLVNAR